MGTDDPDRNPEIEQTFEEQLRDLEEKLQLVRQMQGEITIPHDVLDEGMRLHIEMRIQAEGELDQPVYPFEEYLTVRLQVQDHMKEKLKDPAKRRAFELAREAEDIFWQKRYDEAIQKLVEAAALDPEYTHRLEGYHKLKEIELRKGRVRLTQAINRILYPRLRAIGFRVGYGEDSPKWKEDMILVRTNAHGREASIYMGRVKFGKRFGIDITRTVGEGQYESFDLSSIGLDDDALSYLNQDEANAVLERVAGAFEGPILAWLDEDV
ncbi:MAG: hypothetical protein JXJ17_17340 [Anaerolineae bacterium]|nr:hypothetical protein [Anaerolineae bacterium]